MACYACLKKNGIVHTRTHKWPTTSCKCQLIVLCNFQRITQHNPSLFLISWATLNNAYRLGLARTIRCIHGVVSWETTKYTVKYGVFIRFWPTLIKTDASYWHKCTLLQGRPHGWLTQTVPISCSPNSKPHIPDLNARYLMLYLIHWHLLEIRHSRGLCGARCVFCTHFGREKVHFWTCPDRPLL